MPMIIVPTKVEYCTALTDGLMLTINIVFFKNEAPMHMLIKYVKTSNNKQILKYRYNSIG